METNQIEKAIRENFPGENNKAIRKELRKCVCKSDVFALSRSIAFSGSGKLGLEAIAKLMPE